MRKSNEQHLYERTVRSLPHLDDESLSAIARLSMQLLSARRLVKQYMLKQVGGKPMPQVLTTPQGESHESPESD